MISQSLFLNAKFILNTTFNSLDLLFDSTVLGTKKNYLSRIELRAKGKKINIGICGLNLKFKKI